MQIEHALTAVGSGQTSLGIKGRYDGIWKNYQLSMKQTLLCFLEHLWVSHI